MRYMGLVIMDPNQGPPTQELMDAYICSWMIRTGPAGISCCGAVEFRRWPGPRHWLGRVRPSARIFCRPPSRPVTRAARAQDADWRRIAAVYDVLAQAAPGPVVEVNRAVAHGRAHGPAAGLAVLNALGGDPLPGSPLPHVVRVDLLAHLGNDAAARAELTLAAALTANTAERSLLLRRATST